MRLAAVSIDLDEIPNYHAIHGLPAPTGPGSSLVYDLAVPRFETWANVLGIPLTLFAIGRDMARAESAAALRRMAATGTEIGNHTLDHRYDLTRLGLREMLRQVASGAEVLAGVTGRRPTGFRAPGYTMTDELARVVHETGHSYDASVFPCPGYQAAKAAAMTWMAVRGSGGSAIAPDPRSLVASREPYRMGSPYWRAGEGLREVPIGVTPIGRLPFIGTALALSTDAMVRGLTRGMIGGPTVNLELHGIDALDDADGLDALRPFQRDVGVPRGDKMRRFTLAVRMLSDAGYRFVTMSELALSTLPELGYR